MAQSKQKPKVKAKGATHGSHESDDESEHELFHYSGNRIQLMKEVLKLIKPRKIKSIAPDFMKNHDIAEINSMLLEELLGISNKRLKHILNGENIDEATSSSESEEDKPIDVISLDDISDTDDDFGLGSVNVVKSGSSNKHKKDKHKNKKVPKPIKEEKPEKLEKLKKKKRDTLHEKVNESENERLMSVLEILELQARARAIRSQLALENVNKKQNVPTVSIDVKGETSDESDAIVVDSPKNEEIIITSSESDDDCTKSNKTLETEQSGTNVSVKVTELQGKKPKQKIKIIRTRTENVGPINSDQNQAALTHTVEALKPIEAAETNVAETQESHAENTSTEQIKSDIIVVKQTEETSNEKTIVNKTELKCNAQMAVHDKSDSENDDVINLDIEEMEND